jgi:transposase InsO family protein
MKNKSEVLEKFKEFHTYAMNITGKPIKVLRSDNGGENSSKEFESFLKKNGIVHQLSVPHNPAQNGVAERVNRTIVETTRSMLSHAHIPNEFWAEAVNTSVYVRNRSPCISPTIKETERKSRKSIFMGYPEGVKGHKLYDPVSRKFLRSRDVIFLEKKFHDFDVQTSSNFDDRADDDIPMIEETPVYGNQNQDETANQRVAQNAEGNQQANDQRVGATLEETFMNEVRNIGEHRMRRPPNRFDEECYLANDITADISELKQVTFLTTRTA